MKAYEATEQAYKNGYEQGKKDALKWIPVTERSPEKDGRYICNYHFGEYPKMTFTQVLDYYATDIVPHFQHTLGDGSMKVTHWMPLPDPPKKDNVDRCVCCGEIIPEGRQVCPNCERGGGNGKT